VGTNVISTCIGWAGFGGRWRRWAWGWWPFDGGWRCQTQLWRRRWSARLVSAASGGRGPSYWWLGQVSRPNCEPRWLRPSFGGSGNRPSLGGGSTRRQAYRAWNRPSTNDPATNRPAFSSPACLDPASRRARVGQAGRDLSRPSLFPSGDDQTRRNLGQETIRPGMTRTGSDRPSAGDVGTS